MPSMLNEKAGGQELVRELGEKLLLKGDENYEAARQGAVWRANKPRRFPEAIVMAESDKDVALAVKLAKDRGWKVGVRSGGHGWSSAHVRDGALLIDLSRMQEIVYDPTTELVSVTPSVRGRKIVDALGPIGRTFPGGHHNTVGIGGFAMCGGFGWNAREFGNGSEQIQAIDVVTADGELIHADETMNSDFLWAARGAGTGYFAAVTRFWLSTYVKRKACFRSVHSFGVEQVGPLVAWASSVVAKVPRNVEMVIGAYSYDPEGNWAPTRVVLSAISFTDSEAEAREALSFVDSCPILDKANMAKPFIPFLIEDGYAFGTAADPEGMRYATDSVYLDAHPEVLAERLQELFKTLPTPRSHIFWLNWGPVRPWKDMALSVQADIYLAAYSVWDNEAEDAAMEAWPVDQMRKLEDLSKGSQLNDENMKARPSRYHSEVAAKKLEELRAKYDPEGMFVSFLK
jgi:FAD/FMN-containing dehydrogenase